MNNVEQIFQTLNTKYQNKRELFKKAVDRFKSKDWDKLYRRGSQLLDECDALIKELKSDFLITAEGQTDQAAIKIKLKTFKRNYKELVEITKPAWRQWAEAIIIALGLAFVLRNFIFGLYHVPTGSAEPNILVGDRIWGNKMAYFFSSPQRGDLVIFDNPTFDYDRAGTINYWWQRYIGFPIPFLGLGSGPDNWVKRVIAIPGDLVEGKLEEGKTVIYLNGKKLDEPYVNTLPLIAVQKSRGFLPWTHIGPLAIPSFLQYETKICRYTYDPSKSLDQQPYYAIDEQDIIYKKDTREPELDYAFTPIYDHRTLMCRDVFSYTVPQGKYWVMGDSRKNSQDSRWWLFLDEKLIHGRASFVIYSIDSEESFWFFDLLKRPIDFWSKHIRWNRFFKGLGKHG
jgi:signal peptidase I